MRYCGWCLLLMLAGCGADTGTRARSADGHAATGEAGPAQSATAPLTEAEGRARVLQARRIVSLAPGITELIYAVGAERSLLATSAYSDYPAAAKLMPRIGDAFHVDMEQLLALQPDLVLVWETGTPAATIEQIRALGLRVESIDVQQLSEVAASLLRVGELTGQTARAQQEAQRFEQGMAALRARYAGRPLLRTFVEINREPLYTVNGQHVLSEVLRLCGGRNVFADLPQLAPAIGMEAVLETNPQVILSTEADLEQVQQLWRDWPQINAVRTRRVYAVSPDTTTRASPRLLQGAQEICAALEQARQYRQQL